MKLTTFSRCNYKWWRGNVAPRFQVGDYGQLHRIQKSVQLWFWTQKWCRKCKWHCTMFWVLFLTKKSYNKLSGNLIGSQNNTRMPEAIFSHLDHLSWTPVTESEIYTVLDLFLLMGIVQKPTARSYFSKRRVISTPGFADVISREIFKLICKFWHFIDNENLPTHQGPPILFKIYPVIWHLNINFRTLYLPNQNFAIGESFTLEGASVNKAVPTTKGFKVRNKNFWTMWIKSRIFVVFSCIYRQKHDPTVESDYSIHPQNSSCSTGTFRTLVWSWTYAVDWKLLQ